MISKAENPSGLLKDEDVSSVVRLFFDVAHLKQVYRKGWPERGIPAERCETVAEHSYGVVMLALFLTNGFPELDRLRVLELALLHDFGEIGAGDITPAERIPRYEKLQRERDSFLRVLDAWPDRERYIALFDEYQRGKSEEAKFVHQLEKLEMALQGGVYELQGLGSLGEFLESAGKAVEQPKLREVLDDLRSLLDH